MEKVIDIIDEIVNKEKSRSVVGSIKHKIDFIPTTEETLEDIRYTKFDKLPKGQKKIGASMSIRKNDYSEESLEFIESELLKDLLKVMKRYNILVSTDKAIITNKTIEDVECFEIETIVFKEW